MANPILGLSCFFHDSAVAVLVDGRIEFAIQEERLSRKKHDAGLPLRAIAQALEHTGLQPSDVATVAFYENPDRKRQRVERQLACAGPGRHEEVLAAVSSFMQKKYPIAELLRREFAFPSIVCGEHHRSHAAAAFFTSPFERAVVVTINGVGASESAAVLLGEGNTLTRMRSIHFPHSLGLFYSVFTQYLGFEVNEGEYKVMGLAPYGRPRYLDVLLADVLRLADDGGFTLNQQYFDFASLQRHYTDALIARLGIPPRAAGGEMLPEHCDLAASVQAALEAGVMNLLAAVVREYRCTDVCLGGGVALNCTANARAIRELGVTLHVHAAAGDAGGALGAPLAIYHNGFGGERTVPRKANGEPADGMRGALLGPEFPREQIRDYLDAHGLPYEELPDDQWAPRLAEILAGENVIGLLQGRMEFGPRALGARSIVGDPRSPKMQSVMNLKIKYRESFRPFAPSVLEEKVGEYFELDRPSPYMLLVADVRPERRTAESNERTSDDLLEWVNRLRSDIPAVTHVDYSARIQTVSHRDNPRYHDLISEFERRTGCAVVVNTSFNVRGEPIVCTPEDAYRCFMRTEMDYLVLGPFLLDKRAQPQVEEKGDWRQEYALD